MIHAFVQPVITITSPKWHVSMFPRRCPRPRPVPVPFRDPWVESQCILNKPLLMVIPPEGIVLPCPVHPGGHFVHGSPVMW